MSFPIIGITPSFTEQGKYSLNPNYVSAITVHGATPLILPYEPGSIKTYLRIVSGVVITGGGDIDSRFWGEVRHEKAGTPVAARDEFELALCREAVAAGVPLLGICRGAQILNVALGGSLIQHIDGHDHPDRFAIAHTIEIAPNSKLRSIIGQTELGVNSIHHQCVGARLGEGVSISAVSPDGIVEAVEVASKRFTLGVQWHPEELAAAYPLHAAIFRAFVEASKQ